MVLAGGVAGYDTPCCQKRARKVRTWKRIYKEFFPASSYEPVCGSAIEAYPGDDVCRPDYRFEVWMMVKNKKLLDFDAALTDMLYLSGWEITGYYGTKNSNVPYSAQIDLQTHVFSGWKLISIPCTIWDITELS